MNKKRYIFLGIALSLVLVAGGTISILKNKETNIDNVNNDINTYSSIKESEEVKETDENAPNGENTFVMEYTMNLSSTIDDTDINQLKTLADNIVIAKVKKIDGATNYNEYFKIYSRTNTIGEIEILQTINGDLKENDIVPFTRFGGTIETEEYVKGLNEKRKYLLEQAEENGQKTILDYKYIKELEDNDIDIEEGKTYLMLICYNPYVQRYEIFGEQYGLREYNSSNNTVLNNMTGEWEDLDSLNLK